MASILSSSRSPQCLSCLRRVTIGLTDVCSAPSRMHVRGKKKAAMPNTITVRLLKDVTRFGRQGAIIPVAAGRMRNQFYPKKMAEYVTKEQLKQLGLEDVQLERDPTFGISQPQAKPEVESEETDRAMEVFADLLKPERAMEILSELLPANLDFFRTPITVSIPKKLSPSIPASSAISDAAQEGVIGTISIPDNAGIYGSVSTADIAANLKAILAEDDEGARVVLSPEDITFVRETEDKDRVKNLGVYEIDIMVKGAPDVVRRTIKINAQD